MSNKECTIISINERKEDLKNDIKIRTFWYYIKSRKRENQCFTIGGQSQLTAGKHSTTTINSDSSQTFYCNNLNQYSLENDQMNLYLK